MFSRVGVISLLALVTYALLPVTLQNRLTTLSAGTGSQRGNCASHPSAIRDGRKAS